MSQLTCSCSTESAETVSSVTSATSCFFVPRSRKEWARTIAPEMEHQKPHTYRDLEPGLTWQVAIGDKKLGWVSG